jgi:hypothetical protein
LAWLRLRAASREAPPAFQLARFARLNRLTQASQSNQKKKRAIDFSTARLRREFDKSGSPCNDQSMKLNPTPGPLHQRSANTMLTTLADGTTSGLKFTSNFKTKSQTFQQMNQTIVRLDNNYKGLTSPQQASWTSQASGYTGIQVCGCPASTIDGQKLYRLQNYCIEQFGGSPINTPNPGPDLSTLTDYTCIVNTLANQVYLISRLTANNGYIIFQLGQGNNNPQFQYPVYPAYITLNPGDTYYALLATEPPSGQCNVCNWSPTSTPSGVTICEWIII